LAVAVIDPDFEIVRVQGISPGPHPLGAIPPVPLSGVQVQPAMENGTDGVALGVNVTDCAPVIDPGDAVTLNVGAKIVTTGLRAVRLMLPPSTEIQSTYTCPFSRTRTLHGFWR